MNNQITIKYFYKFIEENLAFLLMSLGAISAFFTIFIFQYLRLKNKKVNNEKTEKTEISFQDYQPEAEKEFLETKVNQPLSRPIITKHIDPFENKSNDLKTDPANFEQPSLKVEIDTVKHKHKTQKSSKVINASLSLEPSSPLFLDEYKSKVEEFLPELPNLMNKLTPLFNIVDNQVFRKFKPIEPHSTLELLFQYWQNGYRDSRLILVFILYFAAKKAEKWQNILIQLYAHAEFSTQEKTYIELVFADLLDSLPPDPSALKLPVVALTDETKLSMKLHDQELMLNRESYAQLISLVDHYSENDLLFFYQDKFYKSIDRFTLLSLLSRFKTQLPSSWQKEVLHLAFENGHYQHLLKLYPENVVFMLLNKPNRIAYEQLDSEKFQKIVQAQKYGSFNLFYFLFQIDMKHSDLNNIVLEFVDNVNIEDELEITSGGVANNQSPQFIKYVYFLYLSINKKYKQALKFYHKLKPHYKTKFYTQLYYARNLFHSNNKEQAWQNMHDLWQKDQANMMLLNEAGVYAFEVGHQQQAEEIFHKMKKLYPQHPVTLHNEALFYEKVARQKIKDRWHKYQTSVQ